MKAKIVNRNQQKILAANLSPEKYDALSNLCEESKVQLVSADSGKKTIGELLGEKISCTDTETYPDGKSEILLFSGFDRKALDSFLDVLKAKEIRVVLKAIYTEHNRSWSLDHLINELRAEHKQMTGGDA